MMMGIGNITELTDADSAGINVLLLGICQELQINSVLTTQVINWAQAAFANAILPSPRVLCLRTTRSAQTPRAELAPIAGRTG
ncbi:MAG: hypothetical protein R3C53_11085 [Pirellulaceae bacterium]